MSFFFSFSISSIEKYDLFRLIYIVGKKFAFPGKLYNQHNLLMAQSVASDVGDQFSIKQIAKTLALSEYRIKQGRKRRVDFDRLCEYNENFE